MYANLIRHISAGDYFVPDLNEQALERMETIIGQMEEAEGVTEDLKVQDQLAWVQQMHNIQTSAREIVLQERIYV